MSKEKGSSFEEIRASSKCTVPLYFAFSLLLVFACAYVLYIWLFLFIFYNIHGSIKGSKTGAKKGEECPIGDAPPVPVSSGSTSIPSIISGFATAASNVQGKQTVDPKYPLWKYVTREEGAAKK